MAVGTADKLNELKYDKYKQITSSAIIYTDCNYFYRFRCIFPLEPSQTDFHKTNLNPRFIN